MDKKIDKTAADYTEIIAAAVVDSKDLDETGGEGEQNIAAADPNDTEEEDDGLTVEDRAFLTAAVLVEESGLHCLSFSRWSPVEPQSLAGADVRDQDEHSAVEEEASAADIRSDVMSATGDHTCVPMVPGL